MHGGGDAWHGACVAGGMHGKRCVWQGVCVVGACIVGVACVAGVCGRWTCVQETVTEVGGTHPVGMHSCLLDYFNALLMLCIRHNSKQARSDQTNS